MIMIPLHYLIAFLALMFAGARLLDRSDNERNRMFIVFLVFLAIQTIIVGTRFGYGVEWLREIQPLTAAVLPPMAYLSFREGSNFRSYLPHFASPFFAVVSALFVNDLLDAVLALNNLVYGMLLVRLGLKGGDGLPWAGINDLRNWQMTLWIIVALLVYSGITDSVISLDYLTTRGENTNSILATASLVGFVGTVLVVLFARLYTQKPIASVQTRTDLADRATFQQIDTLLRNEKLYLDPELNLNRIARRLALPSREVSRAINAFSSQNVSQYVNSLRIEEACRLIAKDEISITNAIYTAGFNTKSNFNREFSRVTGKTPSEWRSENL